MSKFVDYDPLRGVETYADSTYGDHRHQVHYRQDVEPILDLATIERNAGAADTWAKRQNDAPRLYARIPPVVILKLKYEYGVDIFKRDHLKRAFEIINRDFPKLKTTNMVHTVKG